MKEAILLVHGIGNRINNKPGWSSNIQRYIGNDYDYKETIWNEVTQKEESDLFNFYFKRPSFWHPSKLINYFIKKLIFDFALDATAYDYYKDQMISKVEKDYLELKCKYEKVSILAYSLGTWITYDLMKNNPSIKPDNYITFGCNFPFHRMDKYNSLPEVKWINIWENYDVLSMPLKREGIKDIEFKAENILLSWNPIAHLSYLKSRRFCDIIKKEIFCRY